MHAQILNDMETAKLRIVFYLLTIALLVQTSIWENLELNDTYLQIPEHILFGYNNVQHSTEQKKTNPKYNYFTYSDSTCRTIAVDTANNRFVIPILDQKSGFYGKALQASGVSATVRKAKKHRARKPRTYPKPVIDTTPDFSYLQFCDTLQLSASQKTDSLLQNAKQYFGIPYKWGGNSLKGFDCMWFTVRIFKDIGYKLPASLRRIARLGKHIEKNELRKGDVIFFKGRNRRSPRIGHAGTVYEVKNGEVYFVHASSVRGISIGRLNSNYYKKRFITARRLIF